MKLNELTAHEILDLIKAGKETPAAVYKSVKEQISKTEGKVHAYARLIDNQEIDNKLNKKA